MTEQSWGADLCPGLLLWALLALSRRLYRAARGRLSAGTPPRPFNQDDLYHAWRRPWTRRYFLDRCRDEK